MLHICKAFIRFTRPHTMIGTMVRRRHTLRRRWCLILSSWSRCLLQLSIVSVSLMALSSPADLTVTTALGVLQAIIPALFMNVCIVGFNQLCDVEIDKVRAYAAHISYHLWPHCGGCSPAAGRTR